MLLWVSAAVAQACLPPVTCHQGTVTVKLIMILFLLLGAPGVGCGIQLTSSSGLIPEEEQEWIQTVGIILGGAPHSYIALTKSNFLECPSSGTSHGLQQLSTKGLLQNRPEDLRPQKIPCLCHHQSCILEPSIQEGVSVSIDRSHLTNENIKQPYGKHMGAGGGDEMAQQVKVLASTDDLGTVPWTHMAEGGN